MRLLYAAVGSLGRESKISYLFCYRDLSAVFGGPVIASAGAIVTGRPVLITLFCAVLWTYFYLLPFVAAGQLGKSGYEEDLLTGKHDRPIPSGVVTHQGAVIRVVIYGILYLLISIALGVLHWAILWMLCAVIHKLFSHLWWVKNVIMGVGTMAMLAANLEIAGVPPTHDLWTNAAIFSVFVIIQVSLQDFRDIEGDKQVGRTTFPITFGISFSKVFHIGTFIAGAFLFPIAAFVLEPNMLVDPLVFGWTLVGVFSLAIGLRLIRAESRQQYHRTYMWYTYHFFFVMSMLLVSYAAYPYL
jgi:4-hydroxybenzoate polyprenyltransferase